MAGRIGSVDTRHARRAPIVLPDTEITINESMVLGCGQQGFDAEVRGQQYQEKDGVRRRRIYV